jgi:hypothetical protein
MHNVELLNLYCLSDARIIKEHWQMGGECGLQKACVNMGG